MQNPFEKDELVLENDSGERRIFEINFNTK
jgi:hypothetical protein